MNLLPPLPNKGSGYVTVPACSLQEFMLEYVIGPICPWRYVVRLGHSSSCQFVRYRTEHDIRTSNIGVKTVESDIMSK
jgi:hypothetical protein